MALSARAVRRALLPLIVVGVALPAAPCAALDWLVLLVDRSNSIDDAELRLQRQAYIRLLSDAAVVDALGRAQVAIVEFDSRAEIVAGWSDATAAAHAYRRKPPDGLRGQTGIGNAMLTALTLLAGKSGRLVVDISGDGPENVDEPLLTVVRAAAAARAIEVNGLAIVTPETPDIDRYYDERVVNGFVLQVGEGGDFYAALRRKLFFEIAGTRPPRALAAAERPFGDPNAPPP